MVKHNIKKGLSGKAKMAIGVGAGLIAATAAVYLLAGDRGKKNRAKIKKFASTVESGIQKELVKLKRASKEDYQAVMDAAIARYKKLDKKKK